jgi:hypothetical protein
MRRGTMVAPLGTTAQPVVPPKTMCRQQDGHQVAPSLLSCPAYINPNLARSLASQHHQEAPRREKIRAKHPAEVSIQVPDSCRRTAKIRARKRCCGVGPASKMHPSFFVATHQGGQGNLPNRSGFWLQTVPQTASRSPVIPKVFWQH